MSLELKIQQKLAQQLVITPQLQQAIKLLQLSRLELVEMINQELEQNPVLEETVETDADEQREKESEPAKEEHSAEKEVTIEEKIRDDSIDWSNYFDEYNSPGRVSFETEERDTPRYEAFIAHKESLTDHLLWQLRMSNLSDDEKKIGSLIIGNLNIDGYLEIDVEEIARINEYPEEKVEETLKTLQTFDPIGIGAKDLRECLTIQVKHFGIDNPVVSEIITKHLNHLENKNYKAIAQALKIDLPEIKIAIDIIKGLDPRPGRTFSDEEPHYITPDIYVYKIEEEFVILLNDDGMPKLRVNSFYQDIVNSDGKVANNAKSYLQEKMRSATWLIKSIQQRQKTIYKVMESILKFQRDFFERGIDYLKPMVLRDVANDIEMHESTISRVTTNKYVYTPQGIFELKYFFNSSINRVDGEAIASASVQERIKQIIDNEDPTNPYSDSKISELLMDSNVHIARRTVAKYREMLRILPSNKRKQL